MGFVTRVCESQRTEREGEEERGDLHDWWLEGAELVLLAGDADVEFYLSSRGAPLFEPTWRVNTG